MLEDRAHVLCVVDLLQDRARALVADPRENVVRGLESILLYLDLRESAW